MNEEDIQFLIDLIERKGIFTPWTRGDGSRSRLQLRFDAAVEDPEGVEELQRAEELLEYMGAKIRGPYCRNKPDRSKEDLIYRLNLRRELELVNLYLVVYPHVSARRQEQIDRSLDKCGYEPISALI